MDTTFTVIIPVYNEENTLLSILDSLDNHVLVENRLIEVIVVDDGSNDASFTIASNYKFVNNISLRVLRNEKNSGYGYSLRKGVERANSSHVAFFDGDGQHRVESLNQMLTYMLSDLSIELIIGTRTNSSSSPLWRRPGKSFVKLIAENITGVQMPDLFSGLRVWKKESFLRIKSILPNKFSISATSAIASSYLNMKIVWLPVQMDKRQGKSTANFKTGFGILLLIARIFTLFAPLRIFLPVSFLIFTLGMYYTVSSYLTEGVSSMRGLMAILISITITLQGLLVDQISALRRGERISD